MLSSSDVPHTMLSSPPLPHTMLSHRRGAPHDVVARHRCRVPHTMLSSSPAAPHDVVVVAAVPHTMLSSGWPSPTRCCRRIDRAPDDVVAVGPAAVVPHTMLSSSALLQTMFRPSRLLPQTMLSSSGHRCPRRCCRSRRRRSRCPRRCCRRCRSSSRPRRRSRRRRSAADRGCRRQSVVAPDDVLAPHRLDRHACRPAAPSGRTAPAATAPSAFRKPAP